MGLTMKMSNKVVAQSAKNLPHFNRHPRSQVLARWVTSPWFTRVTHVFVNQRGRGQCQSGCLASSACHTEHFMLVKRVGLLAVSGSECKWSPPEASLLCHMWTRRGDTLVTPQFIAGPWWLMFHFQVFVYKRLLVKRNDQLADIHRQMVSKLVHWAAARAASGRLIWTKSEEIKNSLQRWSHVAMIIASEGHSERRLSKRSALWWWSARWAEFCGSRKIPHWTPHVIRQNEINLAGIRLAIIHLGSCVGKSNFALIMEI